MRSGHNKGAAFFSVLFAGMFAAIFFFAAHSAHASALPTVTFGLDVNSLSNGWPPNSKVDILRLWDDGLNWKTIQPTCGALNTGNLAGFLDLAANKGVKVNYTIGEPPNCAYSPYGYLIDAASTNFVTQLAQFSVARKAAGKKGIDYYELMNEPNNTQAGGGGDMASPAVLARFMQIAYKIIKSIDPTAIVVSPSACTSPHAGWPGSGLPWDSTDDYLAAAKAFNDPAFPFYDVQAYHYYLPPYNYSTSTAPETEIVNGIAHMRSVMGKYGLSGLPLVNTEFSWGWASPSTPADLAYQENFLARSYMLFFANSTDMWWYGWGFSVWGDIYDNNYGVRPAGIAYENLSSFFNGATFGTSTLSGTVYSVPATLANGQKALSVWNTAGNSSFTVPSQFTLCSTIDGPACSIANNIVAIGQKPIILYGAASSSTPDTTAPAVSITFPANNANVSSTITVAATASDNVGVTKVEFYLDASLKTTDVSAPYTYSLDTTLLSNGNHTLNVRAYDAAGNIGNSGTVTITVNNTPVVVLDGTPPSVPSGLLVLLGTTSTISITWNPSTDNVGVAGYKIFRNGTQVATTSVTDYTDPGLTPSTTYSYNVAAYDSAGNTSAQSVSVFALTAASPDTTAPVVSITSPATNANVSSTITVAATASDNVGVTRVEFYVDNVLNGTDTGTPYTFSLDTTVLSTGTHTLTAKAYDGAGNVGNSGSVAITVNNVTTTPPVSLKITGVTVPNITNSSAQIVVVTNVSSTVRIQYGVTTAYGTTTQSSPLLTTTFTNLSGLSPDTTYNFLVLALAPGTSTSVSSQNFTFRTLALQTPTPSPSPAPTPEPSPAPTPEPSPAPSPSPAPAPSAAPSPEPSPSPTPGPIGPGDSSSTTTGTPTTPPPFVRLLFQGDTGNEVLLLQIFLRTLGFFPPNLTPTSYFGARTVHAVTLFQSSHNLPPTGILDGTTIALVNKVAMSLQASTNPSTPGSPQGRIFTRYLRRGMSGADISSLQALLITDGDYPEAVVSGYYGLLTEKAVQAYQTKHGIATYGTPDTTGYGAIGPKTRALLNGEGN